MLTLMFLLVVYIGETFAAEDCCGAYGSSATHAAVKPVSDMTCWIIEQDAPDAIVMRIGHFSGEVIPDNPIDKVRLVVQLADDPAHTTPGPKQKLLKGMNGRICVGTWRLKKADFVYFCNGIRTAIVLGPNWHKKGEEAAHIVRLR